jgi:nicotinamide riboside transporter PnuC
MEPITSEQKEKTNRVGWIIVVAIAILFVLWGLFIFFAVGDKGPPSWDFGVIKDIPGESPYSTERH